MFALAKLEAFLARLRDRNYSSARAELEESARVCRLEREMRAAVRARRARDRAFEQARANTGEDA